MKTLLAALALSIILESSITTLPMTLIILLFACVILREKEIIALAFFSGLFLDFLSFKPLGFSSFYFCSFVFLALLYDNKFEIDSPYFIVAFSFVGSFLYLAIQGISFPLFQSLFLSMILLLSFTTFKFFNASVKKYG